VDFQDLAEKLDLSQEEEHLLDTLLGELGGEKVVRGVRDTSGALRQLSDAITRMHAAGVELAEYLQAKPAETWGDLQILLDVGKTIGRIDPVPSAWIDSSGAAATADVLEKAGKLAKDLNNRENSLFSEYESGIVDVVDQHMLIRYRTDHQNCLRRLVGSSYRSDRKLIQAFRQRHGKTTFDLELQLVGEIIKLQQLRQEWAQIETDLNPFLGSRYVGRNTYWEGVERELFDVQALLETPVGDRVRLIQLLTQTDSSTQSRGLVESLERVSAEVQGLLDIHVAPELDQLIKDGRITLPTLQRREHSPRPPGFRC
jgi:hypothetical protein